MQKLFWFKLSIKSILTFFIKILFNPFNWTDLLRKIIIWGKLMAVVRNLLHNIRTIGEHRFNIICKKLIWLKMTIFNSIRFILTPKWLRIQILTRHFQIWRKISLLYSKRKKITKRKGHYPQKLKLSLHQI